MDHMCTIRFHMYSFPVSPQAIHLIYTDRSQATLTWLSWQLDCVLHFILSKLGILTVHKAAVKYIFTCSWGFFASCEFTCIHWCKWNNTFLSGWSYKADPRCFISSSNWTKYAQSPSSLTELVALSSGEPLTGDWEHRCQLSVIHSMLLC